MSGGVGVGVTLVATWGAVVSSLRETPAQLMLPLAPKPGKRILLERIRPLWNRLSFSWKVTCRNMFRYKRRLAMTVAGVAGCTALLLVGFGLHDAIWDIIDCQYGPIVHYDTTVGIKDGATDEDMTAVEDILASTGQVTREDRVQEVTMHAAASGDATDTLRVSVVVPQNASTFEGAVTLRSRTAHEEIPFDGDSLVITEKLATRLGISVGDSVVLRDVDEVGNATGEGHALTVTGICENYVGNYVYVGRNAWAKVDTSVLLGYFGSFEAFDAYEGSPRDVVWDATRLDNDTRLQDEDALALAMRLAGVKTSSELRGINRPKRDEIIHLMSNHGVSVVPFDELSEKEKVKDDD